ncbi:MAG TPA: TrmH family RNA methyltransferase [Nitriliruptorales bacterium]
MPHAADLVAAARERTGLAVLEGLHPLKHALRFGAVVTACVVEEGCDLVAEAAELAPDLPGRLSVPPQVVPASTFAALCRRRPPVPVIAVAVRPTAGASDALEGAGPVVALEDPVHLGNLGAVVRVAAAAGAAGVLTTGRADPWHPAALRGGAGLQFALPVVRVDALPPTQRPVVAFDPGGAPLGGADVDPRSMLVFGSERAGLSAQVRERAHRVVAIPMRDGVSSLNLATSVAVALYAGVASLPLPYDGG